MAKLRDAKPEEIGLDGSRLQVAYDLLRKWTTGTMCWMDPDRDGFCLLFTSAIRAKSPWRLVNLSNVVASAFL